MLTPVPAFMTEKSTCHPMQPVAPHSGAAATKGLALAGSLTGATSAENERAVEQPKQSTAAAMIARSLFMIPILHLRVETRIS